MRRAFGAASAATLALTPAFALGAAYPQREFGMGTAFGAGVAAFTISSSTGTDASGPDWRWSYQVWPWVEFAAGSANYDVSGIGGGALLLLGLSGFITE